MPNNYVILLLVLIGPKAAIYRAKTTY